MRSLGWDLIQDDLCPSEGLWTQTSPESKWRADRHRGKSREEQRQGLWLSCHKPRNASEKLEDGNALPLEVSEGEALPAP